MLTRIVSAVVGMVIFVGVCAWGPLPFALMMAAISAVGATEMVRVYRSRGIRPRVVLVAAGPLLALLQVAKPAEAPWFSAVLLVILALAWGLTRRPRISDYGRSASYAMLCAAYTGMFASVGWLRAATGFRETILVVCMVWATDTAAMYTGKALGRHKLAPRLSPGKTVEGALGGIIGAMVVGEIGGRFIGGSLASFAALGILVSVLGQAGDLLESALKRDAGVKDFGSIMPGHGGALDRCDSLIFVCTVLAALHLLM